MYNRYIPQPDGSYRKNRIPDTPSCPPPQPNYMNPPEEQPCPPPPPMPEPCPPKPNCGQSTQAGDFLRRLLPRNLDTGDLLVIILLLLMAGDSNDGKSNALLTLALYLFM